MSIGGTLALRWSDCCLTIGAMGLRLSSPIAALTVVGLFLCGAGACSSRSGGNDGGGAVDGGGGTVGTAGTGGVAGGGTAGAGGSAAGAGGGAGVADGGRGGGSSGGHGGATGGGGATGAGGDRNPTCVTSTAGCCYYDDDCPTDQECVGARCGSSGIGVPPVAIPGVCKPRLSGNNLACWRNEDCSLGCAGVVVCGCGVVCVAADTPGNCVLD
jgi:hypothetical protein